jgi:uncharacterized membrane protein
MASQKRAKSASGQARNGATATRSGSGSPNGRGGGNRTTAPSTAVRSGKPGRAGAGQGGTGQAQKGRGGAGRGQDGRPDNGQGQNGRGQAGRAQNGPPGQGRPAGAQARAAALTAEPRAAASADARFSAPPWLQWSTLALSLAGLGVSIYLTIAHYTSPKILVCSDKGLIDCAKVTSSAQSMVFGVLPVAVLGLAFYVFMAAINTPWAWRAQLPAIWWARLGSVVVGIGFVLYLLYAEIIQIGNICLWCTSVHAITFLLFVLIVFAASIGSTTTKPAR